MYTISNNKEFIERNKNEKNYGNTIVSLYYFLRAN